MTIRLVMCMFLLGFGVIAGCDSGSSGPTSTVENADQAAIDAYKAAQEQDMAEMDSSLGK